MKGGPTVDGTTAYSVNLMGSDRYDLSRFDIRTGKRAWTIDGVKYGILDGGEFSKAALPTKGRQSFDKAVILWFIDGAQFKRGASCGLKMHHALYWPVCGLY